MFKECQWLPRIKSKHTAGPAFHFPLCWHGLCQVLRLLSRLYWYWTMFSLEIQQGFLFLSTMSRKSPCPHLETLPTQTWLALSVVATHDCGFKNPPLHPGA